MIRKKSLFLCRKLCSWGFILGLLLSCGSLHAAELIPPAPGNEDLEDELIKSNIYISRFFDSMANGLDLFLAGQQYTTKPNKTSVILEYSDYYNVQEGLRDDFGFDFNLRLPNVEEYWQVTFTSYDETAERGVSQTYLRQQPRAKDYGATLGFFKQLGELRTSFQPRIGFAGTLKISHTLTFESIAQRGKNYRVNPKLQFYADADKGTGSFQAINFNFVLSKYYNLTFINEGDYLDQTHTYSVTNGISLGQWFSPKDNIAYNFFVGSTNRPNYQLASYNVSTAYSRILYRNILDGQIQPNLDFSAKYNFRGIPGINLHINLKF